MITYQDISDTSAKLANLNYKGQPCRRFAKTTSFGTPSSRYIILALVLFISPFTYGQSISGKITNQNNKPLEFVTVLLKKDTAIVNTTVSNINGIYSFNNLIGNEYYSIFFSLIGFKKVDTSVIIANNITINTVLRIDATQLQSVTVVNKKPLIERKVDRLVFNVENSILSKGMDLTQVLKGTPMITVSDFGISLVGKNSVAVMIDDKILNMSGGDLMNYLKSLRSDDITKIEIITAPPAKYEAQGNSGIINIILKRKSKLGWSGTFSSAFAQSTYSGYSSNLSLNYQTKKIHTTIRLRQYDRATRATEESNIIGLNSSLSKDERKDMNNGLGANLNMSYKINNKSDIGFIYDIGLLNSNMNIENQSVYKTSDIIDSALNTYSKHRNPILTQTLNTYYDYKIDSLGKKLTFMVNYFSNLPETVVDFATLSDQTFSTENIRNTSKINYVIRSGQVDLYWPFKKLVFEAGTKFTAFNNNSDVKYLTVSNHSFVLDSSKSNVFDYYEKNYAVYATMSKVLGKKWSSKAGLRYEYSAITGHSVIINSNTKYFYGNIFPTFYLQYHYNTNNTISLNYSKRINRPNFRALNPFRWYSNPYSFYTGNPVLRPSYNHNIELTYLYKDMFSVSLYGQKMIGGYGRIVSLLNGIKEVNYKNYLSEDDAGSNASLYLNPFSWWELSSSIAASYSASKSSVIEVLPQKGFSFYYDINNTFTLYKLKQIFLFINFWQSLPSTQGNAYSQNLSSLSTGLRFSLFNKKLLINTAFEDIYKGLVSKGKVYFKDFTLNYNNYYDARRLTLSITYVFGNKSIKMNNKKVQFDDKNRAN